MKKLALLFFGIVLSLGLVACGNNSASPEADNTHDKNDAPVNEKSKNIEEEKVEVEYVDGPLTEVGQKFLEDDNSVVELKKIKVINEIVDMDPMEITIEDIKFLELSNIDNELLDHFQLYSNQELTDPLNYIQISYTAENTSEDKVAWQGFSHVILSNGEQIDAMNNDILQGRDLDSDFYGNVKKEVYIGVPYEGKSEDIESVKIVVGSSLDPASYIAITKEKEVTYDFD